MRLHAAIRGNLTQYLRQSLNSAKAAVTQGIREAGTSLKLQMRQQTSSSGLGKGLANSWRAKFYPTQSSLDAASFVYTRAYKILPALEQGSLIRGRHGLWLAIPTPNVPKARRFERRPTPRDVERKWNVKLRFVYRPNGASLLVLDNRRASYNRSTGELRGFRKASDSALRTGRGLSTVVMFWLVPQVKLPKRIDFATTAANWQRRLPELIIKHWKD